MELLATFAVHSVYAAAPRRTAMDLTTHEAATLLGISERAVRGRLRKGDIPGVKRGRRWRIPKERLPLDETQRRALQAKAEEARAALEAELRSRVAGRSGKRSGSVADLEPEQGAPAQPEPEPGGPGRAARPPRSHGRWKLISVNEIVCPLRSWMVNQ